MGPAALRGIACLLEIAGRLPVVTRNDVVDITTGAVPFDSSLKRCSHVSLGKSGSYHPICQSKRSVPRFLGMDQIDPGYSSADGGEVWTAADVEKGLLDVYGWKVKLRDTRELVGVVDEILQIGSADSDEIFESVLKVDYSHGPRDEYSLYRTSDEDTEGLDYMEFLIPLVDDIVRQFDVNTKCLFITPPEGLLELARIPELLKELKPQVLEFCRQQNEGIKGCLSIVRASKNRRFSEDARQLMAWSGAFEQEHLNMFMPTRRQLVAAGRHDLVDKIMAAGGFLSVAQALKLRSRRRPSGFWEDLRNLDAEIEWFVSGSWSKVEDPLTGEPFYFNQATNEVSSQEPLPGSVSNPIPVSRDRFDVGTAIMPRGRKVLESGRYDLHHAIMKHGGYTLVAQQLGRQPVAKHTTADLVGKIRSFMEEHSMLTLPSFLDLRTHKRHDLIYGVRMHGGINAVANLMNIRPKRYGSGQWAHLEDAAAAVRAYICSKLIQERGLDEALMDCVMLEDMVWDDALKAGTLRMPTKSSVLKAGRSDIKYVLKKFGSRQLAEHLGLVKDVDRKGRNRIPNTQKKV